MEDKEQLLKDIEKELNDQIKLMKDINLKFKIENSKETQIMFNDQNNEIENIQKKVRIFFNFFR